MANLSKFHFARAFAEAYGETPRAYITRRRIERAKDLLRTANLTITEICLLVGFAKPGQLQLALSRAGGSHSLPHVNVFVLDQDRAKKFYTEKLGFEARTDETMDGFRWLTVGPVDQPDLNILLAKPAPPMFSEDDAEALRGLIAKGAMAGETDDRRRAYEDLKAKA